mgnify:CR=1 FL=1
MFGLPSFGNQYWEAYVAHESGVGSPPVRSAADMLAACLERFGEPELVEAAQGSLAEMLGDGDPAAILSGLLKMANSDVLRRARDARVGVMGATVVALSHARLLTLDGTSLKDLILHMPEISFEIFRVLTARIRSAEARLSEH